MKVFVGVSGGVDSSVSAALLKEAGHEVVGVFIRVWQPDFLPCSWREERTDAKRICATLGIPFLELDCSNVYKKNVVDYMIAEYKAGRTPNPDVMCNSAVKFGVFFDTAIKMGADIVATGHYARINEHNGSYTLLAGVDTQKDQSYFLWKLTQEQLSRIAFPIGDKIKKDVRQLAMRYGLHTATKKDSQGLCFLGPLDMHDFLKHFIEEKPGNILNEHGVVIGHHDGVTFLTLGQRHGFTITTKTPHDMPCYIIAKDIENNTITVSQNPHERIGQAKTIWLSQTNWITTLDTKKPYQGRLRYRQPLFQVIIEEIDRDGAKISFHDPQPFIPLGQSLVIYDGDICIGGGIIDRVL